MNANTTSTIKSPAPLSPSAFASHSKPINILIVDDEVKNLTVLETILDDVNYRLVRAESADQALLALVVEEFALLILDIRMPGMSGLELAQVIKERKKTARVPIIFLTAYYNEDQHVLEGYETGAVDYLHKPVNPAILRSKVAIFAELHRNSREVAAANRTLLAEITERRQAEERLRELNETLEQRVTERTEALQVASRRKDEFLATLAHELRNPLAPVRNAIQILNIKDSDDSEVQAAREVINRQIEQMSRLIDELMDVSRINQGKIELKREQIELTKVVEVAVETSRPLIEKYGHSLVVTLPSIPIVLDADISRLAQVVLNLLNNAAKFSKPGARIDLNAERQGSDILISVTDTGIGIPPDKLHSVFELFSQVEEALSRSQGGLGIGLCLAKRIVDMHGGTIEAKSEGLGKGSEFVIRLPIVVDQTFPVTKIVEQTSQMPTIASLRILVVDDNRDAANSLAMLLKIMGCVVRVAFDGAEAVAVARDYRPDVIVLDIGLPKMNGYDVARVIRKESWGHRVVIIAMTGWGQDDDKVKAAEAGFDRHMVKPVAPQSLMSLLAELQLVNA